MPSHLSRGVGESQAAVRWLGQRQPRVHLPLRPRTLASGHKPHNRPDEPLLLLALTQWPSVVVGLLLFVRGGAGICAISAGFGTAVAPGIVLWIGGGG